MGLISPLLLIAENRDSARIVHLNEQAVYYNLTEPSRSLRYLDQAFNLSITTANYRLRVTTLLNIALVYENLQEWNKSIYYLSEAAHLANKYLLIDQTGIIHERLGESYSSAGEYTKAYSHYQIARSYYIHAGRKDDLTRVLNSISILYQLEGSYGKALRFAFESLQLSERISNTDGMAGSLGNLATIYYLLGDQQKSLYYYDRAIKVTGMTGKEALQAQYYCNQGFLLSEMGKSDQAIWSYLNAYRIYKEESDQPGMMVVLNSIGSIYESNTDYKKALNYYQRARQMAVSLVDTRYWLQMTESISRNYFLLGQVDIAERELLNTLMRVGEMRDRTFVRHTLISIGKFYFDVGNYIKSKYFLEKMLIEAGADVIDEDYNEGLCLLSKIYEAEGNFRAALSFFKQCQQLKDSIQADDKSARYALLRSAFNSESRDNERELLMVKAEVEKVQKDRAFFVRNLLVMSVFLILVLSLLLLNRLLAIRKRSRILSKQKQEIETANKKLIKLNSEMDSHQVEMAVLNEQLTNANVKLQESEFDLKELNSTKDKFFSIISHDLRNPFASIVSFSRIMKRDIHLYSAEEIKELAKELDKSVSQINNLLENLLLWSRAQSGNMPFKPEKLNLQLLVNECLTLLGPIAKSKEISMISKLEGDLEVHADTNMVSTIIRNLLGNAIKYSHYGRSVIIEAAVSSSMVQVQIRDSGVGISQENIGRIFSKDECFSTYGTADEKGSGLGLLLCREFVEKHHGEISVESEEGVGTVFSFTLPKSE